MPRQSVRRLVHAPASSQRTGNRVGLFRPVTTTFAVVNASQRISTSSPSEPAASILTGRPNPSSAWTPAVHPTLHRTPTPPCQIKVRRTAPPQIDGRSSTKRRTPALPALSEMTHTESEPKNLRGLRGFAAFAINRYPVSQLRLAVTPAPRARFRCRRGCRAALRCRPTSAPGRLRCRWPTALRG
jgi:hypothetical protein